MEPMARIWTYDDLERMPLSVDGKRYEIIDGELVVSPSPSTRHQRISIHMVAALLREIEGNQLGIMFHAPVDVIMSNTRVVVPDLVAVRTDRRHLVEDRGIFGAPDLIVEILSPRTRQYDQTRKRKLYASVGVPEYWIVDPVARSLELLVLAQRAYAVDGSYEPGERMRSGIFQIELDVAELFRP